MSRRQSPPAVAHALLPLPLPCLLLPPLLPPSPPVVQLQLLQRSLIWEQLVKLLLVLLRCQHGLLTQLMTWRPPFPTGPSMTPPQPHPHPC